jgi:hypothetical protein
MSNDFLNLWLIFSQTDFQNEMYYSYFTEAKYDLLNDISIWKVNQLI